MTVEQLLQPRFKCIADYPKSIYKVGEIFNCGGMSEDLLYCDKDGPRMSDYPHLFKRLNWWEEREIEDMPRYIKCNVRSYRTVFKVSEYIKIGDSSIEITHTDPNIPSSWVAWEPQVATEQEYLDYINSKKVAE